MAGVRKGRGRERERETTRSCAPKFSPFLPLLTPATQANFKQKQRDMTSPLYRMIRYKLENQECVDYFSPVLPVYDGSR